MSDEIFRLNQALQWSEFERDSLTVRAEEWRKRAIEVEILLGAAIQRAEDAERDLAQERAARINASEHAVENGKESCRMRTRAQKAEADRDEATQRAERTEAEAARQKAHNRLQEKSIRQERDRRKMAQKQNARLRLMLCKVGHKVSCSCIIELTERDAPPPAIPADLSRDGERWMEPFFAAKKEGDRE